MKDRVLVLGAGTDRTQRVNDSEECGPTFQDNFRQVDTLDIDPDVSPTFQVDMNSTAWRGVPLGAYDEVHAYECLHLVGRTGEPYDFFQLWCNIWHVLKDDGLVYGTTPWWQSVWAWSDPATKFVYTEELLKHLNRKLYTPVHTNYSYLWSKPYNFVLRASEMRGANPERAGYVFVLQKERDEG